MPERRPKSASSPCEHWIRRRRDAEWPNPLDISI